MKPALLLVLFFLLNYAVAQDTMDEPLGIFTKPPTTTERTTKVDNLHVKIFPIKPKGDGGSVTNTDSCECVTTYYLCNNNTIITDGYGVIDISIDDGPCDHLSVCCDKADVRREPSTPPPALISPKPSLLNYTVAQENMEETLDGISTKRPTATDRTKRFDDLLNETFTIKPKGDGTTNTTGGSVTGTGSCECVPYYLCNNNTIITDGYGVIDTRIDDGPCDDLSVCCDKANVRHEPSTPPPALMLSLLSYTVAQENMDEALDGISTKRPTATERTKRFDDLLNETFTMKPKGDGTTNTTGGSVTGTGSCECVPYYLCNNNTIITDGYGVIDTRIDDGPCDDLSVCCDKADVLREPSTPPRPKLSMLNYTVARDNRDKTLDGIFTKPPSATEGTKKFADLLAEIFTTKPNSDGTTKAPGGSVAGTGSCECVPYYLCNNNTIITDGHGVIDVRIDDGPCEDLSVCCNKADMLREPSTPPPALRPKPSLLNYTVAQDKMDETLHGIFTKPPTATEGTKKFADLLAEIFTTKPNGDGTTKAPGGSVTGTGTGSCECVPYYLCNNNTIITDGYGVIDVRIEDGPCEDLSVCCDKADVLREPSTPPPALMLSLLNYTVAQDKMEETLEGIFTKPPTATEGTKKIDELLHEISTIKPKGDRTTNTTGGSVTGTASCECVPFYLCNNNTIITDGYGVIDIRVDDGPCDYLSVCCDKADVLREPSTPPPALSPKPAGCGSRNPEGVGFRITGAKDNEAQFGEFPWMVAVLREEIDEENSQILLVYHCGGALIHPQVVLTSAHCVVSKDKQYKIRAGEWDTQTKNELFPYQDRDVKTIIIHPEYYSGALFNDIAVLILETPVEIAENVDVVCLPKQGMVLDESRCFASGWGKDVFGVSGKYQVILKKIELPIVTRNICQDRLRTTRLGQHFRLHASFICAGGEPGKDTCKGDGGSPLVCPIPGHPGRYLQSGIVAWGIGCGENQIPGVYANVALFSDWIDEQLADHNFDINYYKY